MGKSFSITPKEVELIDTKYRQIKTKIPVPESLPLINMIDEYEPKAMQGQPPIIWDRADGFQVYDPYGNKWLDWSSGVLVANTGHGHSAIINVIKNEADRGLLFSYCFPAESRIKLVKKLIEITPDGLDKAFLLTTGSETIETSIKLARTFGKVKYGNEKDIIISFELAFHGRTMGAQLAGGYPQAKNWIGNLDSGFIQMPFPDGYHCSNQSFGLFEKEIKEKGVEQSKVAAVIIEGYQGGGASFAPKDYVKDLREWCNRNDALLIFDEVQSGFGRTGKMFAFEHYNIVPDIVCLGKGITSSLPLAAVLGRKDLMDLYGPGEMTSTHGGNPLCSAVALKNIDLLIDENMVENAALRGKELHDGLKAIYNDFQEIFGALHGKGLVYGMHIVKPDNGEPYQELAYDIVTECFEAGLLMFAPVGYGGATIKICPPLTITNEAINEGLKVLRVAIARAYKTTGK